MTPDRLDEAFIADLKSRLTLSDVIGRTVDLKRQGREYIGLSPFQKERTPSFTVNDEKGFYHCFSSGKHGDLIDFLRETEGMSFMEAVDKLSAEAGMSRRPVSVPEKPQTEKTGSKTCVAEYVYHDRDGEPYHRVERWEFEGGGKTFTQSHWEPTDHIWIGKAGPNPPIPYNLPAIIASPNEPIWLVEGEKNADDLISRGLIATTAKGGATAFPTTDDFAVWFDGATVYALPDNDEPGEKWLERVLKTIPHAKVIRIPGLPHKGDVSDWLAAGGTITELQRMASSPPDDFVASHMADPEPAGITPTSFQWIDPADIPNRNPLYGSHLYRRFVSITISPGGIGKSSLVMLESLCMASNRSLLGDPIFGGPLKVWYWNGEDPQDENSRRIVAAAVYHRIKPEEFADRLWMDSGRELQIKLADMARGAAELNEETFLAIEQAISERGIDVLVIDPLVSAHSIPENDNGAMDAVIKRLGRVADRCNCAIELVHHTRKPSNGASAETHVADARGAGAIIAGVRSARMLNPMTKEEAPEVGVPVEEINSYFRVDFGKANLAKRDSKHVWRHLVGIGLGNKTEHCPEDRVGVVEPYEPPESASKWPEDAAVRAQRIAEECQTYRHWTGGPAPSDWFGFAVARDFGMHEIDDKSSIRRMIATWIKSGVLKVVEGYDGSRNGVKYIASSRSVVAPVKPETDDDAIF